MSQLQMLMKIEGFYGKLDEKPNLIGFENGVYDLDAFEFRDGRPEDMLTKSTGYNYTDNVNDEVRDDLMKFFRSIQPNEEMTHGLLTTIAMNLHGTKKNEHIFFWVGLGGNGKGLATKLIKGAFGKYFYAPSVKMFTTQRKSSSQANEDMAKAKGMRIMVSTEPERNEVIQVGMLKELTGGDDVQARAMYGKFFEFVLEAQPFIQMNNRPKLSGNDGGVKRRLLVWIFPYNFVENPVMEHERKGDNSLKDKFAKSVDYHQQFFLILRDIYKEYAEGGFKFNIPQEVLKESQEYLDENDEIKKCLIEGYDKGDADDIILADEVYKKSGTTMSKSDFFKEVENCGYKVIKKCKVRAFRDKAVIVGIKTKCYVDEDDDIEL